MSRWQNLNRQICDCRRCPRLIEHCRTVATRKRRAWADEDYWGGPVPNFGGARRPILIVGLAPGAHGANRTGRMFTGDRSGLWLYRALYRTGLASQAESVGRDDGLKLRHCVITGVCHCAPPDNKPLRDEIEQCREWFHATIELARPSVLVALGGLAWKETARWLRDTGALNVTRSPRFAHAAHVTTADGRHLLGSYHPSQQNTFTGRLTEPMLEQVFHSAVDLAGVG